MHWAHRHDLEPWLEQRWVWLALHRYHLWFATAVLPGVVAIALVQGSDRRTFLAVLHGPLGWLGGATIGYMLYGSFSHDSWPFAVMMPATFGFLGGAVAARLAVWPRKEKHLRGTRLAAYTGACWSGLYTKPSESDRLPVPITCPWRLLSHQTARRSFLPALRGREPFAGRANEAIASEV